MADDTAPVLVDGDLPPGWRWETESERVLDRDGGTWARITVEVSERCLCDVGWTVDENWSDDDWARGLKERTPHDGLIPCGACNHGGWDAPWPGEENTDG